MSQVFHYDVPQVCADEVRASLNWKAFTDELQRADDQVAVLRGFGELLMKTVIEAADRYKDRTGEMIEEVARKTGVNFPHRAQRYVEHALLCSRPTDKYTILKSTPAELRFSVSPCSILPMLPPGAPCDELCRASLETACHQTGDTVVIELARWLPKDGACEFVLRLQR